MDISKLVKQAKDALRKNPSLIEKGGDAVDKVTGGKYAAQVDKAQEAARKAVGAREQKQPEQKQPEPQNQDQKPDQPGTGEQREG